MEFRKAQSIICLFQQTKETKMLSVTSLWSMQKFQKKKNNYRKDNVDSNFLFAEISMRDQMVAMLKEYISEYSCDDINKMDSSG